MRAIHRMRPFACLLAALSFSIALQPPSANVQSRLSDKDIENLIKNVRDDAKDFRPVFNSAVSKSTIRKTSREKDAKNLVASFEKKSDATLNRFKQTKKADDNVRDLMSTGQQIDSLLASTRMNEQTNSKWEKIRSELVQLSEAFGMPQSFGGVSPVSPTAQSNNIPCVQAVGAERAKRLVDECLAVSTATHPPCNAQNSCVLIIDEIKRGCGLIGSSAPAFCSEYSQPGGFSSGSPR
jgi:hypothetical protein